VVPQTTAAPAQNNSLPTESLVESQSANPFSGLDSQGQAEESSPEPEETASQNSGPRQARKKSASRHYVLLLVGGGTLLVGAIGAALIVLRDAPADYNLSARELAHEFDTNREAAFRKYESKVVVVTGEVLSKDADSITLYSGVGGPRTYLLFQLRGHEALDQIGGEVTVRGQCVKSREDMVWFDRASVVASPDETKLARNALENSLKEFQQGRVFQGGSGARLPEFLFDALLDYKVISFTRSADGGYKARVNLRLKKRALIPNEEGPVTEEQVTYKVSRASGELKNLAGDWFITRATP
jgi:hypothetical protein